MRRKHYYLTIAAILLSATALHAQSLRYGVGIERSSYTSELPQFVNRQAMFNDTHSIDGQSIRSNGVTFLPSIQLSDESSRTTPLSLYFGGDIPLNERFGLYYEMRARRVGLSSAAFRGAALSEIEGISGPLLALHTSEISNSPTYFGRGRLQLDREVEAGLRITLLPERLTLTPLIGHRYQKLNANKSAATNASVAKDPRSGSDEFFYIISSYGHSFFRAKAHGDYFGLSLRYRLSDGVTLIAEHSIFSQIDGRMRAADYLIVARSDGTKGDKIGDFYYGMPLASDYRLRGARSRVGAELRVKLLEVGLGYSSEKMQVAFPGLISPISLIEKSAPDADSGSDGRELYQAIGGVNPISRFLLHGESWSREEKGVYLTLGLRIDLRN